MPTGLDQYIQMLVSSQNNTPKLWLPERLPGFAQGTNLVAAAKPLYCMTNGTVSA